MNGGVAPQRRLLLRLDDGSLIGPSDLLLNSGGGGVVRLDLENATRIGRTGKAELERLDRLIKEFQARVSGYHSIPRNELKARNPYTQDVQRQIKRQRSLAVGDAAAFALPLDGAPSLDADALQHAGLPAPGALQQQVSAAAAAAAGAVGASPAPDFKTKCFEVLRRVYGACAAQPPVFGLPVRDVFYRPVSDTFPTIAADYYARIAQPMTFAVIEQRLLRSDYPSPQHFADDMRLVFNNCKQYNPMATDPVRIACLRLADAFEAAWAASGLGADAARSKRATAGIAAPKFEPEEYEGAPPPRRTNSHRSGEAGRRPHPEGLGRLQSHEVSSYREEEVEQHAIPDDVLQEVAAALQELQPENLQVALGKFNEGVVTYDEEGEVELDLERVDFASLMDVDAYIRQVNGLPPREAAPGGGAPAPNATAGTQPSLGVSEDAAQGGRRNRGTVRAEQDDDDDYYEEDDSDDDD